MRLVFDARKSEICLKVIDSDLLAASRREDSGSNESAKNVPETVP